MRSNNYILCIIKVVFFVFPSFTFAQLLECGDCIPGSFIVRFDSKLTQQQFTNSSPELSRNINSVTQLSNTLPISIVQAPGLTLTQFQGLFATNSHIVSISPDQALQTRLTPNDPFFSAQEWALQIIKAPAAWDRTTGGTTQRGDQIVVAVCDDGFFINHEDLKDNLYTNPLEIPDNNIDDDNNGYIDDVHGANAFNKNGSHEVTSHGTKVMSIIGAKGNNAIGYTGINWNVKILPVSRAVASVSTLLAAYDYVAGFRKKFNDSKGAEGALVVATNLSAGIPNLFPKDHPEWCDMYDYLGSIGILSVGAASNANVNVDEVGDLPSTCTSEYLIIATSTTSADAKASDAAYGPVSVDLGAPGTVNHATDATGGYSSFSGTSCATPHVTGAIALLYSAPNIALQNMYLNDPAYAALTVKNSILNTVDKISTLQGKTVTGGRLNLSNMVSKYSKLQDRDYNNGILFPNPAIEYVIYKNDKLDLNNTYDINLFNMNGNKLPVSIQKSGTEIRIEIHDLPAGVYLINVSSKSENYYKKLIKN